MTSRGDAHDADQIGIDQALEALAAGDVEQALGHLEDVDPSRGERWTTSAHALLEGGDYDGAEEALERAAALLGPEHEDVLWAQGRLRLSQWRLDEARAAFARLDPEVEGAPLLENLALLADLEGDIQRADSLYRRATELDPEGSPAPPRLTGEQFEEIVAEAARELPPEFRAQLEETPVVIDPMPSADVVGAPESGHPPDILGLFVGATLEERSANHGSELPPTIFLFQRNLERASRTREELRDEIRTTLYHELGHALGFNEDGVDELGLA
jgi:predicted Zn-dependent protease with MMP-like domain/Flp pilus assembly protein TadD